MAMNASPIIRKCVLGSFVLCCLFVLIARAQTKIEPGTDRAGVPFQPSKHGFFFHNSFEGSPLPPALQQSESALTSAVKETLERGIRMPTRFGLCGGMSAAAADYYHARRVPPNDTSPPKQGTPLYNYLHQRNMDSMGTLGIMAAKFMEWMRLPDTGEDSTTSRSAAEIRRLTARLKKGDLVPVGLVLVKADGKDPAWDNHQVLAYAMEQRESELVIRIYDPNSPGDDNAQLRIAGWGGSPGESSDPPRPAAKNEIKTSTAPPDIRMERFFSRGSVGKVRGIFIMPYARKTPPEL